VLVVKGIFFGQIGTGLLAILYGLAYSFDIHSISFFLGVLVAQGLFQSTGWPGLVPVLGNWFGKSKRGLVMGIWNTHTSVGNIVGTLIAGAFVNTNWGLSFIVPGVLIAGVGLLFFLVLVPSPEDLGIKQEEETEEDEKTTEAFKGEVKINGSVEAGGEALVREDKAISLLGALKIPGVVEFSLCLFFAKLVRWASGC
jgi:OPA family glycerol-3-phosphate transporter-like MFS transporter 1/2